MRPVTLWVIESRKRGKAWIVEKAELDVFLTKGAASRSLHDYPPEEDWECRVVPYRRQPTKKSKD